MKPISAWLLAGALSVGFLSGCGNQQPISGEPPKAAGGEQPTAYKNGTYQGTSSPDDKGAVGEITVTVQQGKIVQADYRGVQKDGKVKDQDYGKTNGKIENQEFYKKAQQALQGANTYGPKLVAVQDVAKVDAVSGATVSYKQFVAAAKKALEQAH